MEMHSYPNNSKTINEYIVFELGEEFYCIRIDTIDRIIQTPSIRFVPNLPDYIEGVIDIDEQIAPIINLKKCLKLNTTASPEETFLFIFKYKEASIGLLIDNVFESKTTEFNPRRDFTCVPENIHPFADGIFRMKDEHFQEKRGNEEELVVVLSVAKIHDVIEKELVLGGIE